MNKNLGNEQNRETQDEPKEDDDDDESGNLQGDGRASTSLAAMKASESSEDTEEDEDDSLHAVSSVKEIKRTTQVVTLEESTHTTATETESSESVSKIDKHLSYEEIIEELTLPAPSTSQVVENMRESLLEDRESATPPCSTTATQPSAVQIIEPIKESLKLETIKGASELSFTSRQSTESASQLSEVERIAHDEVERIVAEHEEASSALCVKERPDFQQVERENQEIAERFKQIMEMFDNFTKNLESLEMPAIKSTEEVKERVPFPLRRRLSFKGIRSGDLGAPTGASAAETAGGSVYNEFYLEVQGESKSDAANRGTAATQNHALQSYNAPSSSSGAYSAQKAESAIDPMHRDIATTVSGLELHSDTPTKCRPHAPHDVHNLCTIGCQTTGDWYTLQASSSVSTSFSNLQTATKDYTPPNDYADDDVVNALIIDTIADATTSSGAGAVSTSFTDTTETSNTTVVKPCKIIHGSSEQTAPLVKIREPPTIIDISQDESSPTRVTTVVSDAPCERTYHTIHIESNSSPSSSEMRRPPLCSRLWNVITDFCAAVCLCLQVNKDCLFCLGFFIAFVVSASFLTAFFYRTLSVNPQLLQTQAAPANIAHVNALYSTRNDNAALGL